MTSPIGRTLQLILPKRNQLLIKHKLMKKLILLFGILIGITTISCSKDDDKTPCSKLNIQSAEDLTCEEIEEEFDCSCK